MSLFRIGDFEVDFHSGELRKNGRITRLQDKPLELLRLLIEQQNMLVTREQIANGSGEQAATMIYPTVSTNASLNCAMHCGTKDRIRKLSKRFPAVAID